jgi:hypothetical protein
MSKETQQLSIAQRIRNLHVKRREILSLPAEKALDEILDYPQTDALVHSFPPEDFYFLIHDIGIEDSLELLSLASSSQWEYILDAEMWEKDKFSIDSATKWLYLLMRADPNRLTEWLTEEQTEFIEHYLFENMELMIREHDQDPSDFGDDFFTFDDVFYIRFKDSPADDEFSEGEKRDAFLSEFLNRLAAYDYTTYQKMLFEFPTVIPAESEEEAYRLRNVRLAEKGFMPFDEAVGVYQPVKVKDFHNPDIIKQLTFASGDTLLPVPFYPIEMMKPDNLFARSLQVIETDEILQQLQTEFAGLCNQVISADQKPIREREELKQIVKKVCGYISIGLERLGENENPTNRAAALIAKFPLSRIFRVGYGLALDLKWRAEKWRKGSWFENKGLPLSFWGEEWLGVLGGLLIKKPMFFDNYKTGLIYREFFSIEDIRSTEAVLNDMMAFDRLLSLTDIAFERFPGRFITHKNLVLTLWARDYLGLSDDVLYLHLDEFRRFFDDLWESGDPRKIKISMKESFLNWLSHKTGLSAYEISSETGHILERLFNEIESEYGEVSTADLDPRYIYLFLVSKRKTWKNGESL